MAGALLCTHRTSGSGLRPREVLRWYFEVWNEPDIDYWHSTPDEYNRLYDYAVTGVRAALPGARVGGPATTSPRAEKALLFCVSFSSMSSPDLTLRPAAASRSTSFPFMRKAHLRSRAAASPWD